MYNNYYEILWINLSVHAINARQVSSYCTKRNGDFSHYNANIVEKRELLCCELLANNVSFNNSILQRVTKRISLFYRAKFILCGMEKYFLR